MTDHDLTELVALLEQQLGLMNDLAALAEEQRTHVEAAHNDALLGLLSRRQAIIDEFTASQAGLTRLTHGLDTRLERVDDAQSTRIRSLLEEIGGRLNTVMQRDADDQAVLMQRRDETGQSLKNVQHGRQANRAYGRTTPVAPRFSDRQG